MQKPGQWRVADPQNLASTAYGNRRAAREERGRRYNLATLKSDLTESDLATMSLHEDLKYQSGEPIRPEEIPAGLVISPDTHRANRIPPGQSRTRKWPVLDAFGPPLVDLTNWQLNIFGLVTKPLTLTLDQFKALPRVKVFSDFHCVTKWSRLGNVWEGVATRALLELAGVQPKAHYVICHGYDNGWTTNLPLSDFLQEDCLLADRHDGEPISLEHGGPVRGMVPQLYAWKSAKWISGIELVEHDRAGYWEEGGYHMHGNPWTEERFRSDQIPPGYNDDGNPFSDSNSDDGETTP